MHQPLGPERLPLVGRRSELEALAGRLAAGDRLLTVAAPSGMGKTRLVRELLREARAPYPRAWFCGLENASDLAGVESIVAQVLGIPSWAGRDLAEGLARVGPALLVLDNFETVAGFATETVERWLDRAPELRIVVTSLLPLGIEGESRLDLGPLDLADAIDLYLDRAQRAGLQRAFTSLDLQLIEELVQRLDRIPLALELAAARVRVLPPKLLLSRISERFDLLQSRSKGPGRRGSLLEAISFTWDLLAQEEKEVLAEASVFAGGFTLEAAEGVLAKADRDVLDTLDSLCSKALLQVDDAGPPRFFLYESIRAFATRKLEARGAGEVLERHTRWFLEAAEAQAARVDGGDAPEAIRWLVGEQENLLAAHRRTLEHDPASAARIGLAIAVASTMRGAHTAEEQLLNSTVEAARRAGDPALLARALRARGADFFRRLHLLDAAERDLREGLAILAGQRDPVLEGFLRCTLASVQYDRGAAEEAEATLREAERLVEESGERLLRGYWLLERGAGRWPAGHVEEGLRDLRRALPIFRELGHLRFEGRALLAIGCCLSRRGAWRESRQAFVEAREVFARLGSEIYEAVAMANLAADYRETGRLDEAESLLREALRLQQRFGEGRLEALILANLGLIALERGDLPLGNRQLREAAVIYQGLGQSQLLGVVLPFLVASDAMLGRIEEAERGLADLRTSLAREVGDALLEAIERILRHCRLQRSPEVSKEARGEQRKRTEAWLEEARAANAVQPGEPLGLALHLLERLLAPACPGIEQEAAEAAPAEEDAASAGLLLGLDAAWFQLAEGERVDIRGRRPLRRLLAALAQHRRLAPGKSLSREKLAQAAWPDEAILPEAASIRVRNAISTLRSFGLAEVLLWDGEGYLLDPRLPLRNP